ncbi:2-hydroxy-6-oxo-6-phenylhexa-2,4-dienoate hydrolase [Ktedonobacter sp. SOSP1-52]|uniref:alpha/beta fold hydrolase n=1 Tax=Ktedonobacter sp. SOSP1-52 TaxID=2778366 RepID=UPI001915E540|nr:alpha/beta hydrolase [Ktedonobacter sp. SOSP1-52]GHO63726.1 2-hydroxy-6-oxo-6-phenylhexa-2,4-dienoate hydrolase [Ktedonobacter sp. SOSP1-52]
MKCNLGDIEIFYSTYGKGRPIVMLPGRPSDHHIMERLMEPLFTHRDGWLRLYPDLPGTGLTPSLDRLATHDQMLDVVLKFIDTVIPGQRFVLAGLSYGGYLARGVISYRADLIDGVMLCAPQIKADLSLSMLPKRTTLIKDAALLAQLEPEEVQLVEGLVVVESSRVIEAVRSVLTEVKRANHAFNERLETAGPSSFEVDPHPLSFEGPTLIMTARQDHLCGYQEAWELLDNYPRATFAVLDGAGHFINIEQDELCRTLMHEWLNRVEGSFGN